MTGKLKRLCPGKADTLTAVRAPNGVVLTDRVERARALRQHCQDVYRKKKKGARRSRGNDWMRAEKDKGSNSMHILLPDDGKPMLGYLSEAGSKGTHNRRDLRRRFGALGFSIIHEVVQKCDSKGRRKADRRG